MRHRRKRDIIIELTSLLDVIMIMIFMVMAENGKLISEKQGALDAAQTELAETDAALGELRDTADSLSAELAEALGKLDEGNAEELREKLQAAESRLDAYKYMDDIVIVLYIGLENKYSDTVRCLSFSNSADIGATQTVCEIHSSDELTEAINRMRVFLSEYTSRAANDESGSTIAYMVFSYDTRTVYQDDYAAVDRALNELEHKANSGNVRYRLNPLNGQ
ncbi:MAG: hypothetical protein NC299_00230 [Lachnospiraceae bacterium]|nr:hypothetical protein [Ruminococcus sp.]MCM1273773.1 hypothetical protein [Lachnospiraceae bacterium]